MGNSGNRGWDSWIRLELCVSRRAWNYEQHLSSFENARQVMAMMCRILAAKSGQMVRWYFAEPAAAAFAEELFRTYDAGRERIEIKVLPWPDSP